MKEDGLSRILHIIRQTRENMRSKLFLVFNHTFSTDQIQNARECLHIGDIIDLPANLRHAWGNIPPGLKAISDFLDPVRNWIRSISAPGDYILIQGDFGACYILVNFSFELGLIPIYSTTERQAQQIAHDDGSIVLTHRIKHVIFRKYGV